VCKILRFLTVIFISQSLIFISFAHADQLALPSGDLIAPQISHEPLEESVKAGSNQEIKATITDNVGIKSVTLFYRNTGTESYKRVKMEHVENTNEYVTTLGIEDTAEPGIEYYIQAVDLAGNALLHGYSFSPLTLAVVQREPTSEIDTEISLADTPASTDPALGKQKKTNKWLWIGLGVLAVGVIAAVAGGSGDDGGTSAKPDPVPETGKVSFSAPVPGN